MAFAVWFLVGVSLGYVGNRLMLGYDAADLRLSMLCGMGGSAAASAVSAWMYSTSFLAVDPPQILTSVAGALIAVFCQRAVQFRHEP
ncbi:MAG: hypothetical protein U0903_19580 [Planctomycetales bacterium]